MSTMQTNKQADKQTQMRRNKPMDLMQMANPLLFASSEEYPFNYQDLKQYLAANAETVERDVKPLTYVNFVDTLLYRKSDGEVDLGRKLACEFALYQVQRAQQLGRLPGSANLSWEQLVQMEPFTKVWYEQLILLLESINAAGIDSWPSLQRQMGGADLQATPRQAHAETQLQELTSYVLSRAVQENIELKPVHMDEPVEFLKAAFNTVLESDRGKHATHGSDDTAGLQTAIQDLQLANTFLTKQFENDHVDYVQNIEKLQRTNKELQQKVLDYHSLLTRTEPKLPDADPQDANRGGAGNFQYTSPVMTSELWFPSSPASNTSDNSGSSTSQSIGVMRAEFKKMLTNTQRKYEKELQQEREARMRLERELGHYKDAA